MVLVRNCIRYLPHNPPLLSGGGLCFLAVS